MNNYQLLIPQLSLLFGIFFLGFLQVGKEEKSLGLQWIVQMFFLVLAFCQEGLLYQVPSTLFINGSLVLDGTTEILSLSLLLLSIMVQVCRLREKQTLTPQVNILTMGVTLFGLIAIESNRILFACIAILGLIWTAHGALAADSNNENQPDIVHGGILRGVFFLFGGIILCVLCFASFGDAQIDEMQRILVREPRKGQGLFAIECFVLFLGAVVMGIPPFQGFLGRARRAATWPLAIGMSGLFAIVGFSLIVRWGVLVFTRPAIGGMGIEPLTTTSFLDLLRLISSVSLIVVPLLSLINRQIRGSILFFILNPFAQSLFALSFGQREIMGFVLGQILMASFIVGIIVSAFSLLRISALATFQEWVGIGRRARPASLTLILAISAAAGMAPFFGSILLQKTLSINSAFAVFPLLNLAFSGFYVARLVILAFHRGRAEISQIEATMNQKLWCAAQLIVLIFMGIFWQPLYKYGAFSIRGFFGEL